MMLFLWNRMQVLVWMGMLLAPASVILAEESVRLYNVPAGPAEETLKLAAEAGHLELVYSPQTIEGVYTRAISGKFSAQQALETMLSGTLLEVVPVREGKAFGIVKRAQRLESIPPPLESPPNQKQEPTDFEETEMNPRKKSFFKTLTAFFTIGALSSTTQQAIAQDAEKEDVYDLTPFTIDEMEDSGYVATNTLGGSRLNTALIDTPAIIDVMTVELLQDIGAVTIEDALEYTVNADNDIGVAGHDNNMGSVANRFNIRGLQATRTRNFFPIEHAVDTYNISRIEEQRGPNSILFGIGSPAGIINVQTKRAILGDTFYNGMVRHNFAGGIRGSFDANIAVNDSFGLRVNAVYSDLNDALYHHAYKKIEGLHVAASVKISDKIFFRGEVEMSDQESVTAKTRPPNDRVSNWLDSPSPRFTFTDNDDPGVDLAEYGISKFGGADRATYVDNDGTVLNLKNWYTSRGSGILYPGNHGELVDASINGGGPGQTRENEFRTFGGAFDIQLGPQTFLELAFNQSNIENFGHSFASTQGFRGSPAQFLPDGTTSNIGAGRLYLEGQWRRFHQDLEFDSYRATLSHEMDFDKWGNYRLALLYEIDDEVSDTEQDREIWVDSSGQGLYHSDPRNSRNRAYRRHYLLEEGNWADYHISSPDLIQGIPTNTGETAYSDWRHQNSGQYFTSDFTTWMVGLQARYFDERLVLAGGYREDELTRHQAAIRDPSTNSFFFNELGERVYNKDILDRSDASGDTKSLGAVYHINENLRVFYNQSDNFGLPSTSRFEYPDHSTARNTIGEGFDYGIGFSFLENRISGRASRFETDSKNVFTGGLNLTNLNDALWDAALINMDVTGVTQADVNANFISGTGGIFDQHVEGYEFAMTANLASNWRLIWRYSYTDGVQMNTYPDQVEYFAGDPNGRLGGFGGITFFDRPEWADLPLADEGENTIGELIAEWEADLAEGRAADGINLAKNRPHKMNVFTRYDFDEGALRGLFVGGGYKWADASQLGVGRDGNGNLFALEGDDYETFDFLLGYRIGKLFGFENTTIQLNVTNVLDWDEFIITGRDVTTGEPTRGIYINPRAWSLSMRFSF